ncbi:hypothetical protein HRbin39_01287 [bacterium HR39]|nr:hypothetical protein HRbin39_01287 [bacterium HR39]
MAALGDPRLPFGVLGGLALGVAAGVLATVLALPGARIEWEGVPVAAGTLAAPGESQASPVFPAPPAERAADRHAPPADPLPQLLEPGPYGALPRIAPDGLTPLLAYARTDPAPPEGVPWIGLVVRGLGLSRRHTEAALALPPQIALAFSPYAEALPAAMRAARRWGHEVMLGLPVDTGDPLVDPGPLAVVPGAPEVEARLLRLLARGQGYGAVLLAHADGSAADSLAPVLAQLRGRGLGIVLAPPANPAAATERVSGAGVQAVVVLDGEPDPAAIDFAFGRLEAAALKTGAAIGLMDGLPLALERLAQWLPGLAHKGFALVPPGRILQRLGEGP